MVKKFSTFDLNNLAQFFCYIKLNNLSDCQVVSAELSDIFGKLWYGCLANIKMWSHEANSLPKTLSLFVSRQIPKMSLLEKSVELKKNKKI